MKKIVINYTNTRTNEIFVSAVEQDGRMILTSEDGSVKSTALSTFKRYYKQVETEVEVEDPKPEVKDEKKPMTKHQKEALKNIKGAYNDYIGGLENSVQDGDLEEMPPIEDLFDGVYMEATTSRFGMGWAGGSAPICMRFAGKKFIREQIAKLFRKDGYEVPEELVEADEKKSIQGHSQLVDGERINLRNDEGEKILVVRAFTGMLIGSFAVEEETEDTYSVTTAKGILVFDKSTGKQINANNPKYANRIEI